MGAELKTTRGNVMAAPHPLASISDEALRAELERRRALRLEEARRRRHAVSALLTRQLVDAAVPEHGLSSCSDTSRLNGLSSRGYRCLRCSMLEVLEHGLPDGYEVRLDVATVGSGD